MTICVFSFLDSYARLGLAASLDPEANGGVEHVLASHTSTDSQKEDMPFSFGRIIRDDTGSVVGVELNDDKPDVQVDLEDVDDVDSRIDPDVRRKWVNDFTKCVTSVTPKNVSFVKGERLSLCFSFVPFLRDGGDVLFTKVVARIPCLR